MSDHTPPGATDLAVIRTHLAHERTLMAWIRTAFSMISFGFTILKFFQYLGESKALDVQRQGISARNLGATLILLGTVSLIGATWQHWQVLKQMKAEGYAGGFSLSLAVAILITAVGFLAFIGAFIRTGLF
jgi:putative membrane protein